MFQLLLKSRKQNECGINRLPSLYMYIFMKIDLQCWLMATSTYIPFFISPFFFGRITISNQEQQSPRAVKQV